MCCVYVCKNVSSEDCNFQMHESFTNEAVRWFDLAWFYGTSTIVGYLIPNPFVIHISSSISNHSFEHKYNV